jgi:addiction module HigA family antidote
MAKRQPAYTAFPPGDLIREELEYRGWSQNDLAQIMGRPLQTINQLINGHKAITARTARELEAALGPDAQFWLNMETSYRLYQEGHADPEISARAKQYSTPGRVGRGPLVKLTDIARVQTKRSDSGVVLVKRGPGEPVMRGEVVGQGGGSGGKLSPNRARVKVKKK